ncbi:hypothetical protein CHELA1G2_11296 [Hyphomicrobiales bacterium]|nr:hypothetical protein CHELA1G2_11296 [Hyphomicrobiales bacterium]
MQRCIVVDFVACNVLFCVAVLAGTFRAAVTLELPPLPRNDRINIHHARFRHSCEYRINDLDRLAKIGGDATWSRFE